MSNNFTIKQVIDIVDKTIEMENKFDCSKVDLMHTIIVQNEKIDKAKNINQYIIDYGFDYDGLNTIESLKCLIDMLVDYAVQVKHILGDKESE